MFCSICNLPDFNGNIKSKCNETGTCRYLSDDLTTGCQVFPTVLRDIPYKNEFCHACNEQPCTMVFQANETDIETNIDPCIPIFEPYQCSVLGPGCVAPIDSPGVKIRNLFTIDQTQTSNEPWDAKYCSDGQLYDQIEKNCRNVTCFPGRHFIGGSCDPLFPFTRNIRYNIEVIIKNADSTNLSNGTEQIILRWLENIVRNHSIGITSMVILKSEIFSNFPCLLGQSNPNVFTYIAFDVFIESKVYRNGVEQSLLKIAHKNSAFEKNNDAFSMDISLASAFSDLLRFVHMAREFKNSSQCWKWEENTELLNKYGTYKSIKIQRQIICPQLIFDTDQYKIDGYSVLLTKYKIIIHYDLFFMDSNNKIRICSDNFLSFMSKRYIKSSTEYALEITTVVCGVNIGYGGSNCFISDIPQIAAFICPVGVICVINIWLFGFTAYKLYTRPIIQSTANDKQDLFVYIKLFSLTGITWIGQIVDSFIPLSVFSFVVTLLTGLQGLFIFLSFVCNKRVINLYWGMCKSNHSEYVPESIRLSSLSKANDADIKTRPFNTSINDILNVDLT
ncbi:MTH [Mytilus coruscus]|uniref:MTH n=1 Tax=Mytilus coruscus TaxID=42192 RepID=A0A6J8BJ69_MYTCO|nr:MTH [Mytilus coruscus]